MLASHQPQPPHLLGAGFPFSIAMSYDSTYAPLTPRAARGIKKFFPSKSGEAPYEGLAAGSKAVGECTPRRSNARTDRADEEGFVRVQQGPSERKGRELGGSRSRPSSPEQNHTRSGPSLLPAIRKRQDGRWQAPSLSRGSVSTSALTIDFGAEQDVPPMALISDNPIPKSKRGHKHSLSLFSSKNRLVAQRSPQRDKDELHASCRPYSNDRGRSMESPLEVVPPRGSPCDGDEIPKARLSRIPILARPLVQHVRSPLEELEIQHDAPRHSPTPPTSPTPRAVKPTRSSTPIACRTSSLPSTSAFIGAGPISTMEPLQIRRARQDGSPAAHLFLSRTGPAEIQQPIHHEIEPITLMSSSEEAPAHQIENFQHEAPTISDVIPAALFNVSNKANKDVPVPYSPPGVRSIPPQPDTPSLPDPPFNRSSTLAIRPALRPRHTTGSKIQVSFADQLDLPPSPRDIYTGQSASPGRTLLRSHSRERTHSLVRASSKTTLGDTMSSAAFSIRPSIGYDTVSTEETDDANLPHAAMGNRQERRMSEKTLQDARMKIRALQSSEELPEDVFEATYDVSHLPTRADNPRDIAHSLSLAALEGRRAPLRELSPDGSPRSRPSVRRGQSLDVSRQDFERVLEEDEQRSAEGSRLSDQSVRPSVIRRYSANGRVYVPKRSIPPAPSSTSPASGGFNIVAFGVGQSSTDVLSRRQSEGFAETASGGRSNLRMNLKNHSMINLSTPSVPPSFLRGTSANSVMRPLSLQVIEFSEPGLPPVRYQLGNCIGRGQFGSVYRSLNLSTGQMAAIKRIRLTGMQEEEVRDVIREVELLKRLSHPSIVKYEGMSREEEYLNIVLEYVENGSLGQTLKAFGHFNEKLVSSYVAKILEGLVYLHSQGVVHCDLKAANILSTKNGHLRLSDFGVSLNVKAVENIKQEAVTASKAKAPTNMAKPVSDVAGTPNWMAPEVISLNGALPASDIWSLGCTIIELLTGKPPYADIANGMTVLFRIVEDEMPPLPNDISEDLHDFLKLCFTKNPDDRPGALLMSQHPWVTKQNPDTALRPQDSVPFLRRADMRRGESSRLFSEERRDLGPMSPSLASDNSRQKRHSMASSYARDGSDSSSRRHVLVKTSFAKPIICNICNGSIKKAGVLCQNCNLICHAICATRASPRCDINEQLALLVRQHELLSEADLSAKGEATEEGKPLVALPGKILNGWKRSKSALSAHRSSSVDQLDKRAARSSISLSRPGAESREGRPSMDTDPSSVKSRGSALSGSSLEGESRRKSILRFELSEEVQEDNDAPAIEIMPAGRPLSRMGKGRKKGKESKSDCTIM